MTIGMFLIVTILLLVVPIIWVLASDRSRGGAKFGWLLIALFFSWVGLAAFLILTQPAKDR